MVRYIGLDVHSASTTVAVVGPTGKRIRSAVVETAASALVEQVKSISGPRHLCLEEGTSSQWLYETLQPHVDKIVVTVPKRRPGNKSDNEDAFALAEQMRLGALENRVYKPNREFGPLRALAHVHSKLVKDHTRILNRFSALLRSRGIPYDGIPSLEERDAFVATLPEAIRRPAQMTLEQQAAVAPIRAQAEKAMIAEARKHRTTWKVLTSLPGIGEIRAAHLMAIVVTPHRFRSKTQFKAYAGLGIVTRSSSDWRRNEGGDWTRTRASTPRGLNKNYNRWLKEIMKSAAHTIATQLPNDPLRADYLRLIEAGTKPNLALLTIARKLAAITLTIWKNMEVYDPTKLRRIT